jgi:hypothetical protein
LTLDTLVRTSDMHANDSRSLFGLVCSYIGSHLTLDTLVRTSEPVADLDFCLGGMQKVSGKAAVRCERENEPERV